MRKSVNWEIIIFNKHLTLNGCRNKFGVYGETIIGFDFLHKITEQLDRVYRRAELLLLEY